MVGHKRGDMTIEWHYNENPPEPEEEGCGIAYLGAVVYDEHLGDDRCLNVERMWYEGHGHWSDSHDAARNVYAWAEWPAAPPQTQATTGGA